MNFTRIEYFLVAAECLNFTKAANILYISQPSLSKQIALLEDELGVPLFDRKPRNLQLTPAGKLLYYEFSRLMPEIDTITERVKRLRNEEQEALFIGSVSSVHLGDAATKIIRDFSSNAPNTELFFERHGFETLHNKVSDGSIDVAFTISTQISKMKDILCADIEQRSRYVIMSTENKLAAQDMIKAEDLRGETFILHGEPDAMALCDDILEECERQGFYPKIRFATGIDAILDYLEFTGGVSFLDKSITNNRIGRLTYRPMAPEKSFSMVCVWKKNNRNPALREFIKHLP